MVQRSAQNTDGPLETYHRRYSRRGLMNRYANGRVRYYLFRQSTFVLLATLIGILLSPNIGLICFLVAV
ncbi:hypothetical protein HGG71_13765, partial [Rhodobacteraceae bacterium R_SAG2]|nr:hypothetical protein [Rhodobacteraceae bacterium R_SAG2]